MKEADLLTLFTDPTSNTDSYIFISDQEEFADEPIRFKQILNKAKRCVNKQPLFRNRVKKSSLPIDLSYWHE